MFRELIEDAHAKYNISDEDMKDMCKKAVNRAMFYVNSQRSGDKVKMDAFLIYILSDSWYKEFIKELKALIDKYLKKHDSITEQELYEKLGFSENWRKITRYRKQ